MNGLPYYKRYPRDFIEGTVGMPLELKGTYSVLIDLIYMQGGRLPDDPRYIAGLLGCSVRAWNGYRRELLELGKIEVKLGTIRNLRADKELVILRKYQDQQAENGGHAKKNKRLQKPSPGHTEPEPEPKSPTAAAVALDTPREEPGGAGVAAAAGASPEPRKITPQPLPKPDPADLTDRERVLLAMGLGVTGQWHDGGVRGLPSDCARLAKWRESLSIEEIEEVIRAKLEASRAKRGPCEPHEIFMPSRFSWFDGAIADYLAAKAAPLPPASPASPKSNGYAKAAPVEKGPEYFDSLYPDWGNDDPSPAGDSAAQSAPQVH